MPLTGAKPATPLLVDAESVVVSLNMSLLKIFYLKNILMSTYISKMAYKYLNKASAWSYVNEKVFDSI